IGEMRDTETVRAALQAAETGHLVLSTLHTVNATETVNRVVDFFPPHQQGQIRWTLAGALRGIVCQRLVPTVDGGLVPGLEVLVNTGRIAERIADPDKTAEIHEIVAEGQFYGMTTFDQSLLELVRSGRVSIEKAMEASSAPHDFQLLLQQAGLWRSSAEVPPPPATRRSCEPRRDPSRAPPTCQDDPRVGNPRPRPAARPGRGSADRRRFLASFETMRRIHGRNGAGLRKRARA